MTEHPANRFHNNPDDVAGEIQATNKLYNALRYTAPDVLDNITHASDGTQNPTHRERILKQIKDYEDTIAPESKL